MYIMTMLKRELRCELDIRNEKVSYKVREHFLQKIPYILVIGQNEMTDKTVTIRTFGEQQTKTMSFDDFVTMVS